MRKTAAAAVMVTGLAFMGAAASGAAAAETRVPIKTGFAAWQDCVAWLSLNMNSSKPISSPLDATYDGKKYTCVAYKDGSWTAVWIAP